MEFARSSKEPPRWLGHAGAAGTQDTGSRGSEETPGTKAQEHLKAIWAAVHQPSGKTGRALHFRRRNPQRDLCARSPARLARCGLLGKFHYLSTVSGGGYIGGWLTAWILRAEGGLNEVTENLARPRDDTRPNPEPTEMQNLRSYSNYLSPQPGSAFGRHLDARRDLFAQPDSELARACSPARRGPDHPVDLSWRW